MLHKISDFVNKIRVIHDKAEKLYIMKYSTPKAKQTSIDNMIQDIQSMCYMVSQDKKEYSRVDDTLEEKMAQDDGGW